MKTRKIRDDDLSDLRTALEAYHALHDGLSKIIESGDLNCRRERDYIWLVESLAQLGAMPANQ